MPLVLHSEVFLDQLFTAITNLSKLSKCRKFSDVKLYFKKVRKDSSFTGKTNHLHLSLESQIDRCDVMHVP